jgi:hypothetical protein
MGFWQKISILLVSTLFLSGCTFLDKRNVAGLQVITNNTPSSLFLDGQYLDKTPFIDKEIKPGKYTLRIEPDDQTLTPHETQISLKLATLTVVTWKPGVRPETSGGIIYEMEEIKSNQGELSFITIPDNAIIRFDQGSQQFSPLALKSIEPGHHQFEISLPSYEKQQHTINVIKGYRINVTAKLAKIAEPEEEKRLQAAAPTPTPATTQTPPELNLAPIINSTQSGQLISINPTGFYQDGKEVLKVRDQASPSATIIGYAQVGKTYPYLETLAGWHKIQLDNKIGWVSGKFSKLLNE